MDEHKPSLNSPVSSLTSDPHDDERPDVGQLLKLSVASPNVQPTKEELGRHFPVIKKRSSIMQSKINRLVTSSVRKSSNEAHDKKRKESKLGQNQEGTVDHEMEEVGTKQSGQRDIPEQLGSGQSTVPNHRGPDSPEDEFHLNLVSEEEHEHERYLRKSLVGSDVFDDDDEQDAGSEVSEIDANILLRNCKDKQSTCKFPKLNLDEYLPEIKQFSSVPEFVFYSVNCINLVCAIYMFATGLSGIGWENGVKSIIIQDDSINNDGINLGVLDVSFQGILIASLSFVMYTASILGTVGFHYAVRQLIYMNLGVYAFIFLIQLGTSLSVLRAPDACHNFSAMRAPMLEHLQKFHTDSLSVTGTDPYQDHNQRIKDMQLAVSCCGVDGYTDYKGLPGDSSSSFRPPLSCCNRAWKQNVVCNFETDEKYPKFLSRIAPIGCEQRVRNICNVVMGYLAFGGIVFSGFLMFSLLLSYFSTLYQIRIQKIMVISEIVYVERLNLFMPEFPNDEDQGEEKEELFGGDDPGEKKLVADMDKIHLSEKVAEFVGEVRKEYGMDDLRKKKRIVVKKIKKDKIVMAPFEMRMAAKRKFSLIAGRHNYFLNRQMLKYAARIVTAGINDDSYAKERKKILDEKMRLLRENYKKEQSERQARAPATSPISSDEPLWKFDRRKKLKPVPKSLIEHYKEEVAQKLERKKLRGIAREEKRIRDELKEEENARERRNELLARLLSPKPN